MRLPTPLVLLLALSAAVPVAAQDTPPDPMSLVKEAMAYAAGLDSLAVEVEMRFLGDIQDAPSGIKSRFVLAGEKKLFIAVDEQGQSAELYSDGETKHIYIGAENMYIEDSVQENRAQLIGLLGSGPLRVGALWFGGFLHNKTSLLEDVEEAEYVGEEVLPDHEQPLHQVRLADASFDAELWLEKGEKPLLQQVVFDFAKALEEQPENPGDARIRFTLTGWQTNFDPPDSRFTFEPPEDAVSYEEKMAERNKEQLQGEEAPQLKLPLLDGGALDLAAHKGKEVVVLDFWATWCGPCRMALPIVDKLAKEFEGQEVAFYAVNLREDTAQVKKFVEQQELSLNIALDEKGEASTKYNISSIPRMVIVGKDGRVVGGHTGVPPDMEQQLRGELNELLADSKAAE